MKFIFKSIRPFLLALATLAQIGASHAAGAIPFINLIPGIFSLKPGQQVKVGRVSLRLTNGGDMQVVNSNGTILWRTGTTASCESSNCEVVIQSDGNMVLYGPHSALWSSGTWGHPGATFTFQDRAAYLTARDSNYKVIWTSGGRASKGMLNSVRSTTTAAPVQSFLESLGVNAHMDQYEHDANLVLSKMKYLGLTRIRDHYADDGSLLPAYKILAAGGIRINMLDYSNDLSLVINNAKELAALGQSVLTSVEGPNEINNFPFSCNGSVWLGGWPNDNGPAAQCYMTNYYKMLKAEPELTAVALVNLTGNTSVRNPVQYGLLSLTNQADYGNIHVYPSPSQPFGALLSGLASVYQSVLPSRAFITETGYTTSGENRVSLKAQATMIINIYLSAFLQGFKQTYIYEPTDNPWEGYGFYDSANNAKPSAVALHNLTTILADGSTPILTPGTLNYSLSGMPTEGHRILLQKSSGAFELILWDETQIWNGESDVSVPVSTVKVRLGSIHPTVKLFRPFSGTAAVQTWTNVSSVDVALDSNALILEVVPYARPAQ